jgi:GNAT superfamily N-acetyltransferase
MTGHPVLVAGDTRLDTLLITAAAGRMMAKGGAEGVQGLGVLPSAGDPGDGESAAGPLGCVVKIEDGSARPIPALVAMLLRGWRLEEVATAVESTFSGPLRDVTGLEVGHLEALVEPRDLWRRSPGRPGSKTGGPAAEGTGRRPGAPWDPGARSLNPFARRDERVTVCRGDEKEVLRFLREQWPAVDEQYFGRTVEWSAEPHSLVYRRDGKIMAALKGHFIGGLGSVDELMVAEGSRGTGLGSLLLGRFEEEARRRGCSQVTLRAVKGSAAESFYLGRGYHRESVQYGYEFGCDFVRLRCDVGQATGEAEGREHDGRGGR